MFPCFSLNTAACSTIYISTWTTATILIKNSLKSFIFKGFKLFSCFYIVVLVVFDMVSSIKYLYIKVFRCFKALLLNYAFIPNCQKVPKIKQYRHFSTHSVLKYHCSTKYIRSRLVYYINRQSNHIYAIANWLRVCSTSALIRLIMFNSSSLV